MKYIISIIIIYLFRVPAFGQPNWRVPTDTVFAKGYILKEIAKRDILKGRKSARRRGEKKESIELPIDISERYIFLPVTDNLSVSAVLDSMSKSKLTSFYTFCPVQIPYRIFSQILGSDSYEFTCKTPAFKTSNLYRIKGYKYKLYEIYYVEGIWLKIKYNPKLNYISSSFRVESIDSNKDIVDLYYLLDYTIFNDAPEIQNKRIKRYE